MKNPPFFGNEGPSSFRSYFWGEFGDLPFEGNLFKDIKKASAVLAGAERLSAELVFFMSLKRFPSKGRPSLYCRFGKKTDLHFQKINPHRSHFFWRCRGIVFGADIMPPFYRHAIERRHLKRVRRKIGILSGPWLSRNYILLVNPREMLLVRR